MALKSEGTYYRAGADAGDLESDHEVGAGTEGVEVFSYVNPNTPNVKVYVVWTGAVVDTDATTTTYTAVDVLAPAAAPAEDGNPITQVQVTAAIPEATPYTHIHFGVWAALGEAEADGGQDGADLGIGFLQNYSGEGLTGADMPNNGEATYSGNWVATVRGEDPDGNGDISLESGAASLVADLTEADITATLDGLATLSGDIAGNTFSGDEASDITHMRLDDEGEFTGSFSGGFYGAKAAEAGGVFAFTSEDQEAGEFSGAFGADRK